MVVGIIGSGIIGFAAGWFHGVLAVLISGVITAFVAVVAAQLHIRNNRFDGEMN